METSHYFIIFPMYYKITTYFCSLIIPKNIKRHAIQIHKINRYKLTAAIVAVVNNRDVHIVIINYNSEASTISCLDSVLSNINDFSQITLIDNEATPDSIETLSRWIEQNIGTLSAVPKEVIEASSADAIIEQKSGSTGKLLYLPMSQNLGFTGASNVGINIALTYKSDYVFLLNNDTTVQAGLLSDLLETITREKVAAVSPALVSRQSTNERVNYPTEIDRCRGFRGRSIKKSQSDDIYYVDFLSGAALLLDTDVLNEVGLFREDFFLYTDDLDMSLRIKDAGYELCYDNSVTVEHDSSPRGSLSTYYGTRNRLILITEYLSGLCRISSLVWYLSTQLIHICYWISQKSHMKAFGAVEGVIDFMSGYRGKNPKYHE
ncbi:glycosyltransferase family 2 protein [Haloarcula marismortui]|uniref:glycosyltransferase family 2 protein n=1 Tax=Haloarcula marismortui TaxID=2238 RepID=UPI003C751137